MGGIKTTGVGTSGNTNAFTAASFVAPTNYDSPYNTLSDPVTVTANLIGLEGATTGNQLKFRASAQHPTSPTNPFLMGHLTSAVTIGATGVDGTTFANVNYVKPGAAISSASWVMDGITRNGMAAGLALVTVGSPVNLMTDVPEPATFALMGVGAVCVGLCMWRRRKKA